MKAISFVLLPVILTFSCERVDFEKDFNEHVPVDTVVNDIPGDDVIEKTASVAESDIIFGFNLFREILKSDESDNVLISPVSVALALAMTYNGAVGDTKAAFETALRKQGYTASELNESYKNMVSALASVDPKVFTQISNSIWYDSKRDIKVLPDFISLNKDYYNAEIADLDFDSPDALNVINGWVNDQTEGKIGKILNSIDPDALMYLINAIYFKGIWRHEFDSSKTFNYIFHSSDGTNTYVDFMKLTDTLNLLETPNFAMAEIPYGQGNFSMLILLPQYQHSTEEIADSLTNENWISWIQRMNKREVHLTLPKFRFSYDNELKTELTDLGMGLAFSDQADFSGINGKGGLKISKVIHKSFIEVNEAGTEAAAVTAVEILPTSMDPASGPYYFYADRPFLFAIREVSSNTILFLGRVRNPLTE